MKVEHTLSPTVREFVAAINEQLNKNRQDALAALGRVKELEIHSANLQFSLSQALGIVERSENLPKPMEGQGYRLSEDGTKLIGETAEPPAAAAPPPAPETVAPGAAAIRKPKPNGADANVTA